MPDTDGLSDNYVQNTLGEKKKGLLGIYLSSVEESYFEVFFLNSCKQKERDTHEHVYTPRDIH